MTKQELLVLVDELKVTQSNVCNRIDKIRNDKKDQYLKVITDVFGLVPNTEIFCGNYSGDSFQILHGSKW